MLKRLFTIVLAAVMSISIMPSVTAAKLSSDYANNSENIYYLWGDFETPEQIAHITTSREYNPQRESYKTTELTLVDGGAEGSKKAIKVKMDSSNSDDWINFHFPAVANERYDISFWIKTEETDAENVVLKLCYFNPEKTEDVLIPLVAADGKWHQYSVTWECDDSATEYNNGGGGAASMRVALSGCEETYSFCIDRISAKPYGYMDKTSYAVNYDAVNTHYNYIMGNTPAEPEYGNADTNPFSDISSHWGREVIRSLAGIGIINGTGDGKFAPDTNVTRAEFIKMATGVFNDRQVIYDGRYKDVAKDSWYAPYIAKADSYVILADELKTDSKLHPDTAITREEAASIIAKAAEYKGAKKGKVAAFIDESKISDWAKDAVKAAASYGIINGYQDGSFRPDKNITRAEAAKMLSEVVEITDRLSIYVDADTGNDKNDGTSEAPLKTVEAARDMARKYSAKMQNDLFIFIRGEHYFDEKLELDDRHSGKNGYDIVYTSWGEEKPVFTMAKKYTGFELHDAENNIWKINVGKGTYSRHAYFNEVRGTRSRTVGYLKNVEFIDAQYYLCDNTEFLSLKYPTEVEAVFHVYWTNNRYIVKSFEEQDGRVRINLSDYFHENNYRIRHSFSGTNPRTYTPSYMENAYEFLDETGEWYLDKHEGFLYYIPRAGEEMSTMELKLPLGVNLIGGSGTTYQNLLSNVTFDNIKFEGTTWSRVEEKGGHAPIQNGLLTGSREEGHDGKTGQSIGAALRFERCQNITFTNNLFTHMGLTCLEFYRSSKYITLEGNEFGDTSSHSMLIDDVSVDAWEFKKPREDWCEYFNINNNYIHHCAMDEHGSASVGIGYVRNMKFTHNIILYSVYSGISSGWGWNTYNNASSITYNNEYSYNLFQDIMRGRVNDGAAIYNLGGGSRELDSSADAPNNGINKNRIINNYFLNLWACDAFYTDSGSSNFYVANNVTDMGKYHLYENYNFAKDKYPNSESYWHHAHSNTMFYQTFVNNYSTHDYAKQFHKQLASSMEPTKLYPDRNWPDEALQVMSEAGIEEKYRKNFDLSGDKVFMSNDNWQKIKVGNSVDPGLLIYGIGGELGNLEDYDIRWSFSDPEALKFEDEKIVALKHGIHEAEARVIIDGVEMSHHFMFECYDHIDSLKFRWDTLNMLAGQNPREFDVLMTIDGETTNVSSEVGNKLIADIKMEDPEIASIEYDEIQKTYVIRGLKKGKTKVIGQFDYEGFKFESNIEVTIIEYGSREAESLPFKKIDLTKNWTEGATPADGGTKITAMPAYWTKEELNNELVAFDMSINAGNNWPSLVLCANKTKGDYTLVDCYMIGFRKDMIELQRWRNGQRIYIFGDEAGHPVGGPGVPNWIGGQTTFKYDRRHSIVAGALETPEGTRIVLTINGVNVIDYLDNSEARLPAKGYFGAYNPSPGGTTFYPYTALTYENY